MEVVSKKKTNQCDLYKIRCDCGRVFEWPEFLAVVDCHKCKRKELLFEEKQDDPGLKGKKLPLVVWKIKR
jgi:hypothetical protein